MASVCSRSAHEELKVTVKSGISDGVKGTVYGRMALVACLGLRIESDLIGNLLMDVYFIFPESRHT